MIHLNGHAGDAPLIQLNGIYKVYRAGDVFYEPPMHTHRFYRNLNKTEPAELIVFTVTKMGEPLAVRVNQ